MKAILVGAGRQLYFMAREFVSKGHCVVVVCREPDDARWIVRRLQKATVLHGDGSVPSVLEDAGAQEAEVVIAATPRDPDNLLICQVAQRRFGVPITLALVSDPDNQEVFPKLGVKNVVSMTQMVSSLIEHRTAAEEISNLTIMGDGTVNVTELVLPEDSPAVGKPLSAAGLPRDTLVASVVRDATAIIPRGDTALAAGDRIVLVTLPSSYGPAVKYLTGEA
jgi:trk system potassium uptake protein TrkA